MTPVSTQGTDRAVKSFSILVAAGGPTEILPPAAGVNYRVVASQISLDGIGTYAVFHGDAYDANKVIAEGFAAANGGSNPTPGDWADQTGVAGEAVKATITGANARIVLFYVEIKPLV